MQDEPEVNAAPPESAGNPAVPDPAPSPVVAINAPVTTKFKVFRSFSIDESHVATAGAEIELTAEQADRILKESDGRPPMWPVEGVEKLTAEEIANLSQHDDPAASKKPAFDSDTHDSVGNAKAEPGTVMTPFGPRGVNAMPDSMDEAARAALATKLAQKGKSTVTDAVDSIGNRQVVHDGEGKLEGDHPQNFGPRGANAPKDSFRG